MARCAERGNVDSYLAADIEAGAISGTNQAILR